jgi:ribosomal protein L37AE/L43A
MKCPNCKIEMAHICDDKGCGWECDKCDYDSRKNKTHVGATDWKEILKAFMEYVSGGKK